MLILQRKEGQSFLIGDDIVITVQEIGQGRVRLAVEAPRSVPILRKELADAKRENCAAADEKDSPLNLLHLLEGKSDEANK